MTTTATTETTTPPRQPPVAAELTTTTTTSSSAGVNDEDDNDQLHSAEAIQGGVTTTTSASTSTSSTDTRTTLARMDFSSNTASGGEDDHHDNNNNNNNNNSNDSNNSDSAWGNVLLHATDLSNIERRIWIITTACLPWRTGTAINPLMRALYLTRGRQKYFVTLVIPWLNDIQSRKKLYGQQNTFEYGLQYEQEEYIRNFCRMRANCCIEESNLRIMFYNGIYHESFGSIFPTEDICNLIPKKEADIAILEEPEHLNWFRVIVSSQPAASVDINNNREKDTDIGNTNNTNTNTDTNTDTNTNTSSSSDNNIDVLGWTSKFQHVIGILHTNYGSYMRQYGMGTSIITAPALDALSSLVVRAYCHKVIKLSATLTSFDSTKEITSNVHGVRAEFLFKEQQPTRTYPPPPPQPIQTKSNITTTITTTTTQPETAEPAEDGTTTTTASTMTQENEVPAPVYFIGKLIWAKGFEMVLEVQELYRAATGQYFPMDIYGGGNDEKEIQRAFFGRKCRDSISPPPPKMKNKKIAADVFNAETSLRRSHLMTGGHHNNDNDNNNNNADADDAGSDDHDHEEKKNNPDRNSNNNNNNDATTTTASEDDDDDNDDDDQDDSIPSSSNTNTPLDILGDLSGKTISTGVETADAALHLIQSIMEAGVGAIRGAAIIGTTGTGTSTGGGCGGGGGNNNGDSKDNNNNNSNNNNIRKTKTTTRPPFLPRSRFKWRRHPIPARFLGVLDHIELRDIHNSKIFLNMSTSEVLCTTSAEAIAMNKFVILPKHPSNDFFLQFPNCLAYENLEGCLSKIQYALNNEPIPLSKEHRHVLSWEGAIERLYVASGITRSEATKRREIRGEKPELKAARFHVEAARRSKFIAHFFSSKLLGSSGSSSGSGSGGNGSASSTSSSTTTTTTTTAAAANNINNTATLQPQTESEQEEAK